MTNCQKKLVIDILSIWAKKPEKPVMNGIIGKMTSVLDTEHLFILTGLFLKYPPIPMNTGS